jgi:nucleoside-diphosphate-sugar epimerase
MREACPEAHLLKLGTMGEYGTPGVTIPEGFFEIQEAGGLKATLPFPKAPGSFYHATKVHDTTNLEMANRIWGIRATDVMQGVVYGTRTSDMSHSAYRTRFDFDSIFGTVINRFCVQAILGLPLTVYGQGNQIRGFLPLIDSIRCMRLILENPAEKGEYRVFNQLEDVYSINKLANAVARAGESVGLNVEIDNIPNPRVEKENHFFGVECSKLKAIGYEPTTDMHEVLRVMLEDLFEVKDRLADTEDSIMPKVQWAD